MKHVGIAFVFIVGARIGYVIPTASAQTRTAKTTNLVTTDLGGWCDGEEVTVEVNEFSPGQVADTTIQPIRLRGFWKARNPTRLTDSRHEQ